MGKIVETQILKQTEWSNTQMKNGSPIKVDEFKRLFMVQHQFDNQNILFGLYEQTCPKGKPLKQCEKAPFSTYEKLYDRFMVESFEASNDFSDRLHGSRYKGHKYEETPIKPYLIE